MPTAAAGAASLTSCGSPSRTDSSESNADGSPLALPRLFAFLRVFSDFTRRALRGGVGASEAAAGVDGAGATVLELEPSAAAVLLGVRRGLLDRAERADARGDGAALSEASVGSFVEAFGLYPAGLYMNRSARARVLWRINPAIFSPSFCF